MLNFLHLTDLHFGLKGQKTLWPNTGDAFYDDLERLREKTGPWQVVLFTGDLVQQGQVTEFDELESAFLQPLWKHFERLGCNPLLLAVPGNHDLSRPDRKEPGVSDLLSPKKFLAIEDAVFDEKSHSPARSVIDKAFDNYRKWWSARIASTGLQFTDGSMPGDFAVTLSIDSHLIGIAGLNTTFLQLAAGDFKGKLAVRQRQLHRVCGGDAAAWAKRHDACLLLTHQGPSWLTEESRDEFDREINTTKRFAVHLFGHEHELEVESRSRAGSEAWRTWQGAFLFGLETFGDSRRVDRRHGYSAGRLDFLRGMGSLQLWPRKGVNKPRWRFVPDYEGSELDEDTGAVFPVTWKSSTIGAGRRQPADLSMWTLARAQDNLTYQLQQLGHGEAIEIQHIGLDMFQAHTRLVETVREVSTERYAITEATLRLLVVGSDARKFTSQVPHSVEEMTRNVTPALNGIEKGLNDLNEAYKRRGKELKVEIRSYHEVPTIHGFSLMRRGKPESPIVTYLSFCRWKRDGSDLEWGAMSYRRVVGSGEDPFSQDLIAIFAGAFNRLWSGGRLLNTLVIGKKDPARRNPKRPSR